MGSGNTTKLSKIPKNACASGEQNSSGQIENGGGSGNSEQKKLIVELVQINAKVHSQSKIGDFVLIQEVKGTFQVEDMNGKRLGNIPAHRKSAVLKKQVFSGRIYKLTASPLKVSIIIE